MLIVYFIKTSTSQTTGEPPAPEQVLSAKDAMFWSSGPMLL